MRLRVLFLVAGLFGPALDSSLRADIRTLVLTDDGSQVSQVEIARGGVSGFTVGWRSADPDGLRIQRFSPEGLPSGPVVQVTDVDLHLVESMAIARDANGHDLVMWRTSSGFTHVVQRLFVTAFDATGARLFPVVQLAQSSGIDGKVSGYSAVGGPAGGWIAAWTAYSTGGPGRVYSQRIQPTSGLVGTPTLLADQGETWTYLVGLADGGETLLAAWSSVNPYADTQNDIVGLLLDANGGPIGTPQTLVQGQGRAFTLSGGGLKGTGSGRFLFIFARREDNTTNREIFGLSLDGVVPAAPPFHLGGSASSPYFTAPELDVDRFGRALFSWTDQSVKGPNDFAILRQGRLLSGLPFTPATELLVAFGQAPLPTVSVGEAGDWVVAWPRIPSPASNFSGIDAEFGSFQDGCEPSATALCLTGNRFRATATFHDHLGHDGVGQAVALTPESGTFWFFTSANVELILKVVDACGHPDFQDFWVYASGLTDVAVTLTVVDTWTGEIWERETDLGEPFPPVLDSQAFHTCDALPLL
ncbi:MAG: hypothetical protein QG573_1033 [Acidobacteriota bacterium]|nr:hypothetical protein [Acidobacteriota bacterium]